MASGKTPAPLLDRWNVEIVKVLNDPGVKDALNKHGLSPHPTTRKEFAAFMKKEYDQWGAIVKERKITAQ
jgi:tripartite-type tricarboxylate transporter receptor subunit TctC